MRRSRETIEAEIAALQVELAAAQPNKVTVTSRYNTGRTWFEHEFGSTYVYWSGCSGIAIDSSDAAALRDWLNYHFPKTEETV